jgi:protein phosphatase
VSNISSTQLNRRFIGLTDPGIVRSVNQDTFYTDPQGRFFIVADGMGGHAGGQEASQIAADRIQTVLENGWEGELPSSALIEEAFQSANQGILDDQINHPERGDSGTTAVVILFRSDGVWTGHVGDSRLYRLREENLEQITEDHTWVARALKIGDITPEQAKKHALRHVLFQCIGRQDLKTAEIDRIDVQPGDRFLLCSDGLSEEVTDAELKTILLSDSSYEFVAVQLLEAAKAAGGSDNITVVLVVQD